LSIDFVQITLL